MKNTKQFYIDRINKCISKGIVNLSALDATMTHFFQVELLDNLESGELDEDEVICLLTDINNFYLELCITINSIHQNTILHFTNFYMQFKSLKLDNFENFNTFKDCFIADLTDVKHFC